MDTFLRLKKLLAEALNIREEIITRESTLDDLYWEKRGTPPDSMDIVELTMKLEEELAIEVPEDDLNELPFSLAIIGNTTVQEMADLIDKKAKK
ncbi:MAG: Phosphopantetheine attachment site [Chthonomonadaceae bacterium]|nr:Phosphopantetheine attachment site [Chthonomonadaceae bacterium]